MVCIMSLGDARELYSNKLGDLPEASVTPAGPCVGCPNLRTETTPTGRTVSGCAMEMAGVRLGNQGHDRRSDPTAISFAWALDIVDTDERPSQDILELRRRIERAPKECPIIDSATTELVTANPGDTLSFTPPAPLLNADQYKAAMGTEMDLISVIRADKSEI